MRPCSCSRIGFYFSPYWRDKGWQEALRIHCPMLWMPGCDLRNEELFAALCQGAAWAARAGAGHLQHRQLVSLPAQCSAVAAPWPAGATARATGHGWSQAQSLVSSTVDVSVTQEPAQGRTGAWLWVGQSAQWGGAGDGAGRASLQHSPAGMRAQGGQEQQGQAALGTWGVWVHPAGSDQNFCQVQCGCKQPILTAVFSFYSQNSEQCQYLLFSSSVYSDI